MPTEAQILDAEKLKTLNRYLLDEYVLAHINPRAPEVALPDHLKDQTTVTLKLSRLFRGSLQVKTDRLEAELLFGQSYFVCVLPFNAIWGITTIKGENIVWGQSAPPPSDLKVSRPKTAAHEQPAAVSGNALSGPAGSKAPFLRRVK